MTFRAQYGEAFCTLAAIFIVLCPWSPEISVCPAISSCPQEDTGPAVSVGAGLYLQVPLSSHAFQVPCRCDLNATESPGPEPARQPCATLSQQDDKTLTRAEARNSDKFLCQILQVGESVKRARCSGHAARSALMPGRAGCDVGSVPQLCDLKPVIYPLWFTLPIGSAKPSQYGNH